MLFFVLMKIFYIYKARSGAAHLTALYQLDMSLSILTCALYYFKLTVILFASFGQIIADIDNFPYFTRYCDIAIYMYLSPVRRLSQEFG